MMNNKILIFLFAITMLTNCAEDKGTLAAPADVPAGLEILKLNEKQAKLINNWVAARGYHVDPSECVEYIESLLRYDQIEAFDKIIKSAHLGNPSGL